MAGLAEGRDALSSKLTTIQVDQGLLTVATKKGLRPTANPDVTSRTSHFKAKMRITLGIHKLKSTKVCRMAVVN